MAGNRKDELVDKDEVPFILMKKGEIVERKEIKGVAFYDLIAESENMQTIIWTAMPKKKTESYNHIGEETHYVLEGEIVFTLDERLRIRVKKGDTLWFPSTVLHKWENDRSKKAVIISVVAPPSFM